MDRLAEKVAGTDKSVIMLYENVHVPNNIRNQSMDTDIDVLTTRPPSKQCRSAARPRSRIKYRGKAIGTGLP